MGYQIELFQKIDDRFLCEICQDVVKQPEACSQCDTLFCYECIEALRGSYIFRNKRVCPHCQSEFETVKLDRILNQIFLNHKVKCMQCGNEMKLEDYQGHEMKCSQIQCPHFGCSEMLSISQLDKHETNQCQYVPIMCENEGCGRFVIKNELQEHMQLYCQYSPQTCQACQAQFIKKELSNHVQNCGYIEVRCENFNCNTILLKKDLEIHLKEQCKGFIDTTSITEKPRSDSVQIPKGFGKKPNDPTQGKSCWCSWC